MFDRQFDRLPPSVDHPFLRYRIMLKRANGDVVLARLCRTREEACHLAKKACKQHVERLKTHWWRISQSDIRPKEVFVETWRGGLTSGSWVLLRCDESPFRLPFKFHDRPRAYKHNRQRKFKSGEIVDCVLLQDKTRKGGWRAKVPGTIYQGPVTDWQSVPATKSAGESILLKVCSVSAQTGESAVRSYCE